MTIQEALQIIDQATAQTSLPRLGHIQVQQAIEKLRAALKPQESEVA